MQVEGISKELAIVSKEAFLVVENVGGVEYTEVSAQKV
jgi:hypothetical protein